jgi:hypothetical protein
MTILMFYYKSNLLILVFHIAYLMIQKQTLGTFFISNKLIYISQSSETIYFM